MKPDCLQTLKCLKKVPKYLDYFFRSLKNKNNNLYGLNLLKFVRTLYIKNYISVVIFKIYANLGPSFFIKKKSSINMGTG